MEFINLINNNLLGVQVKQYFIFFILILISILFNSLIANFIVNRLKVIVKKTVNQIDWYIPHQANLRIINGSAKKLGITENKVIKTVNLHANTSAASIPLALSSCVLDGKIKKNNLIALCAIGGGLTWGSCILKI